MRTVGSTGAHRPLGSLPERVGTSQGIRRCYRICNDPLIFKALVHNGNGHDGPAWACVPLTPDALTSSWARYALADSRLRRFESRNVMAWIPQLMASRRKLRPTIFKDTKLKKYRSHANQLTGHGVRSPKGPKVGVSLRPMHRLTCARIHNCYESSFKSISGNYG